MMWWWGDGRMGAAGWIGLIFMILVWVAIIVGLVYLFRYLFRRSWDDRPGHDAGTPRGPWSGPREAGSDAVRILEERYARGEIDREEFLQRRADLERRTG